MLRILQIADSAFPLGSYSFSSGLESMARLGLIRDLTALEKYLRNVLTQISCAEIPFVTAAFAVCGPGDDRIELEEVFRRYDAFVTVPTIRKSSVTQGRSLLSVTRSVYPERPIQDIIDWLRERDVLTHFAPVFGMTASIIELPREEAVRAYGYMAVRDQISAAVRLGILGPFEGQRLLRNVIEELDAILIPALDMDYRDAFRSSPVLEIGQANHSRLYSRLFQS